MTDAGLGDVNDEYRKNFEGGAAPGTEGSPMVSSISEVRFCARKQVR